MPLRIFKALAILALCSPLRATSIPFLLKDATTVVIGTESREIQSGTQIYFDIAVERTLLGEFQPGQVLSAQTSPTLLRRVALMDERGYRGIWFLKQDVDGKWICIPAAHSGNGFIPFSEFFYPVGSGSAPPELAYDSASTAPADKIVLEMVSGEFKRPELIINAVSGLNAPAVERALRYLAEKGTGDTKLTVLAALLNLGDLAAIRQVQALSPTLNTQQGAAGGLISAVSLFRNPDPAAIVTLGSIASAAATPLPLRSAAAQAVSAIHTNDAVPWLGKLLADESVAIRLSAARGLSFFANGIGIPTPESMPTLSHLNQRVPTSYATADTQSKLGYTPGGEEAYIAYWTTWWNQHPELAVN